jgi:crotonobetainyl-CoA:carnitine CoA-transferase CaiB-like acyl-CoA transferase
MVESAPLSGALVIERGGSPGVAYAGRLLVNYGAEVVMAEPANGVALRRQPPLLPGSQPMGTIFAYLAAGKRSLVCDPADDDGRHDLAALLGAADIYVSDGDEPDGLVVPPSVVYVTVRPFGASGPKWDWKGTELTLVHAGGEGNLLPNGLSAELFPGRPPLKIYGYFAEFQGGALGALAAITGLLARDQLGGQHADVSVQDAMVAVGAFALQRFGDGSLEDRATRSFRYGGVIPCADGYVELLTLEERQWAGLVDLLGRPEWATRPEYRDPVVRGADGPTINRYIRDWAATQHVNEIVPRAQQLGVPMASYQAPQEIIDAPHTVARHTLVPVDTPGGHQLPVVAGPVALNGDTLGPRSGPPTVDADRSWFIARRNESTRQFPGTLGRRS